MTWFIAMFIDRRPRTSLKFSLLSRDFHVKEGTGRRPFRVADVAGWVARLAALTGQSLFVVRRVRRIPGLLLLREGVCRGGDGAPPRVGAAEGITAWILEEALRPGRRERRRRRRRPSGQFRRADVGPSLCGATARALRRRRRGTRERGRAPARRSSVALRATRRRRPRRSWRRRVSPPPCKTAGVRARDDRATDGGLPMAMTGSGPRRQWS